MTEVKRTASLAASTEVKRDVTMTLYTVQQS